MEYIGSIVVNFLLLDYMIRHDLWEEESGLLKIGLCTLGPLATAYMGYRIGIHIVKGE